MKEEVGDGLVGVNNVFLEPTLAVLEGDERKIHLGLFRRENKRWSAQPLAQWDNTSRAKVFRSPDNRLFVGLSRFYYPSTKAYDDSYWALTEIDRSSGDQLQIIRVPVNTKDSLAIDDSGRLYVSGFHQIFRVGRQPDLYRIAGTGLEGKRDGPASRAELGSVEVLQFFPDGSALFVDDDPADSDQQIIRRLLPAE